MTNFCFEQVPIVHKEQSNLKPGGTRVELIPTADQASEGRLLQRLHFGLARKVCFTCPSLDKCAGGKVYVEEPINAGGPIQAHIFSCVGFDLQVGNCPITTAPSIPISITPQQTATPPREDYESPNVVLEQTEPQQTVVTGTEGKQKGARRADPFDVYHSGFLRRTPTTSSESSGSTSTRRRTLGRLRAVPQR